jgi:hypothetical protein
MKLIIQNDRIAATATDAYQPTGNEQAVIDQPEGFDTERMGEYVYADGVLSIAVPQIVTMRQARLALLQSGHYATVVDYITGMTGDAGIAARVTWEYSTTVERYMPLTIQLKGILGLTDLETDELYLLANTL